MKPGQGSPVGVQVSLLLPSPPLHVACWAVSFSRTPLEPSLSSSSQDPGFINKRINNLLFENYFVNQELIDTRCQPAW